VPVIARMQASAIGGGLLLALACDVRVCAASARIGIPASRFGLMLSPVEYRLLVRAAGRSRAKLLMFTGRRLDARTALEWGLVDMIAYDGELDARVDALTAEIAAGAPLANKAAKRLIDSGRDGDLAHECYREIYSSQDVKEGLKALAEKRLPQFRGE
jgi:enoyl-CoA hydratase/carnithine racemase